MSNNSIQLFESAEIRFVEHPEKKYAFGIVAADLAVVLEASSGKDVARSVDDEWKGAQIVRPNNHNVDTNAGSRSVTVIWEPGIYQLLAKSRKPKAKPFQEWLFEQVLPQIRETGEYVKEAPQPVEVPQPVERIVPQRDTVDYIEAAEKLKNLPDGILKQLLSNALVDQISLEQNLKYLPVAEKPKKYTIAKVRAKMLGYSDAQIGNGSALGRFVRAQIEPAFQETIGRYPVFHYEINDELDQRIHCFFS